MHIVNPRISARGRLIELGEGGGGLFNFPKSWPDMIIFLNTSSVHKQQHKLFINRHKKLILHFKSLNRGTISTCNFFPNFTCSQTETMQKS